MVYKIEYNVYQFSFVCIGNLVYPFDSVCSVWVLTLLVLIIRIVHNNMQAVL